LEREGIGLLHQLERADRPSRAGLLEAGPDCLGLVFGGRVRPHAVVERPVLDDKALVLLFEVVESPFLLLVLVCLGRHDCAVMLDLVSL